MRILHIALLSAAFLSPALAAKDQLPAYVKAEAESRAARDEFAGAVLVAQHGKPIYQGAFGYADRERKTPNSLDTRFRFGSMGKMFTAVAALQLVQAGKLSLDAPLGKYLTDYPNKEVAAVTIEQLLTHTGGTGNIFSPEYFDRRLETRDHQDYIDLFGTRGVAFAPGSRRDYSNYGMVLLGRVIEVVSGQSYYDYSRTHIFEPLAMGNTGNDPEDSHVRNLSTGYTHMGPRPGLNAHRLLDATHTGMLLKPLGFSVRTHSDGARSVGHGGGAPGMNGELLYFAKTDCLVVVLSNLDPPGATELAEFIVALVIGNSDI